MKKCRIFARFLKSEIMAEIIDEVKEIIAERLSYDKDKINEQTSFTEDLGADSLDLVELIMELEKHFDITIPEDESEKIHTVGDVVTYIKEHKK
jgi:acyl carrier protein